MSRKNHIAITGQFDDQITGKLGKVRDQFDRLGKSKGAQTVLQGVGMGAGISAWGLMERGIGVAVDAVSGAISSASDLRESLALNSQVFERNADEVEAWAASTNDAFSKSEAINYAAQFGNALKNVGFELDDVTAKSQAMATLAADLGSAFNASSEEAATALRSGLLGESEPLRRFGVFLDEAKVKAKAAAMGLKPLNGQLSDGQKVTARYALIMEQTADSQGMFGRDTGSLADAQKRLDATLEDVSATLAEEVVPALADFTSGLADIATEATKDGGAVDTLTGLLSDLANSFDPQPTYEAKTALGEFDRALSDVAGDVAWLLSHPLEWNDFVPESEKRAAAMRAEADALRAESAALVDFRAGERASLEPGWELHNVTKATARQFDHLAGETNQAIEQLKNLPRAAEDALDALLEATLGPEELTNELSIAKAELKENRERLEDLEAIKHPTKDQREDIRETRGAVIDSKEEVIRLTGRLEAMGQLKPGSTQSTVERLLGTVTALSDEAKDAYRWIALVNGSGASNGPTKGGRNRRRSGTNKAWADGGYAAPGDWGTVGEDGMERLVMLQGGGAMVIPNAGRGPTYNGGESVVVHTHVNLDGREVARVVDQHLFYAAEGN